MHCHCVTGMIRKTLLIYTADWVADSKEPVRSEGNRSPGFSCWNLIWKQSVPSKVIHTSELTSTPVLEKIRLSTYCLLATWHNLRCQVLTEKQLRQICDSLYISNMASDKKSLNLYKTFFFFSPDVQYSRRYTFGNRDRSRDHRQSKESTAECQKEFYRCSREGRRLGIVFIYRLIYLISIHIKKKTKSISHTVLWWFNSSLEIHFENHNKCHICTAD